MFQLTRVEQLAVMVLLAGVLVAGGLFYHRSTLRPAVDARAVNPSAVGSQEVATIRVDVGGAVWWPRVYTMPRGARIADVLEKALVREDANLDGINRARVLRDGEKVFIPSMNPALAGTEPGIEHAGSAEERKVNINAAGITELDALPGVGPTRARAIITYRERRGRFTNVEELKEVPGITEKLFESLKSEIVAD